MPRMEDTTQALSTPTDEDLSVGTPAVGHAGERLDGQRPEPEDLRQDQRARKRPLVGDFPYVFLDGIWRILRATKVGEAEGNPCR